jgi:Macrocin-O-methyltransferase (TylF)
MAITQNNARIDDEEARILYLDLLKKCVMNTIYEDPPAPAYVINGQIVQFDGYSSDRRLAGRDWPTKAHTMIGLKRLNNIQALADDVLNAGVEGDFLEAGVARGGATIFMRGILKAYGIENRTVWVADSFCGFPSREQTSARSYSSPEFAQLSERIAAGDTSLLASMETLKSGMKLEDVKKNFERYGLLDDRVQFLPGYFHETLPSAPVRKLAILRADGDLYDSTYQILENLYPRVSVGGYVIVDDYHSFIECRQAVHDYLDAKKIRATLVQIDQDAVFWQKQEK